MPKTAVLEKSRDLLKKKIQEKKTLTEPSAEEREKARSLRKQMKRIQRKLRMRSKRNAKAAGSKAAASA